MNPAVSIIIPSRNSSRFLRTAVESVLLDSRDDLEILIIDENSTDGTLKTVESLPRVRCLRQTGASGPVAARNQGLNCARGEFVGLVDSDDRVLPGSIRWRMDFLQRSPEIVAAGGSIARLIDENGDAIAAAFPWGNGPVRQGLYTHQDYRAERPFLPFTYLYLFRRSLFDEIGLLDETYTYGDNVEFLHRVLKRYPIWVSPQPVYERRCHSTNLTWRYENGTLKRNQEPKRHAARLFFEGQGADLG